MMTFRIFPSFLLVCILIACSGNPEPVVNELDPPAVSAFGGKRVRILGDHFGNDTRVFVGSMEAEVLSVSKKVVEFATPTATAGFYDIRVISGSRKKTRKNALELLPVELRYDAAPEHYFPPLQEGRLRMVRAWDADADGDMDIVALDDSGRFHFARNQGQGRFEWVPGEDTVSPLEGRYNDLLVADVDGEGREDLFLCGRRDTADARVRRDGDTWQVQVLDPRSSFGTCEKLRAVPGEEGRVNLMTWRTRPTSPGVRQLALYRRQGNQFVLDEGTATAVQLSLGVHSSEPEASGTFDVSDEFSAGGAGAGRFSYDFSSARTSLLVSFPLAGVNWIPQALRLHFLGDASGNQFSVAIVDANGERFSQPGGTLLSTQTWGQLDLSGISAWPASGGDENGEIDLPLTALEITLDGLGTGLETGAFYVDNLILIGEPPLMFGLHDFEILSSPVASSHPISGFVSTRLDPEGFFQSVSAFNAAGAGNLLVGDGADIIAELLPAEVIPLSLEAVHDVLALDVDHDGDVDLLAFGRGQDQCLINDGRGIFFNDTSRCLPLSRFDARAVVAGDMNLNGLPDLVVAVADGLCRLFPGKWSGGFSDATPAFQLECERMHAVVILDADGDGLLDVLFIDEPGQPVLYMAGER